MVSGGPVHAAALDDDPGVLLKTGPAHITSVSAHNTTAADAFVQMFNAAALGDVTLGSTTPDYVIVLAANATVTSDLGLLFPLGCAVFATTAVGGSTGAAVDVSFGVG